MRRTPTGSAEDRVAKVARVALGASRLANGGVALVAPQVLVRRLGDEDLAGGPVTYALRLFGIRTVLIGADLWFARDQARRHAVRTAPLIHASDVLSAATAGVTGVLPRRAAVTTVGISSLNTLLALLAQRSSTPA